MVATIEKVGWIAVFVVLIAFGVPWFMWRSDAVVAGLPVWLWWHTGWMVVASIAFWVFGRRAWGLGVADAPSSGGGSA